MFAMMMARMLACAVTVGLLSLASCGDAVHPASQAVVSLHVAQLGSGSNLSCTPGPHWASVPYNPLGGQQVSATSAGARALDGENGMTVKCTVAPAGDKFKVTANLVSPAVNAGNTLTPTTIVFSTTIGAGEEGAPGRLEQQNDDKTEASYRADACSFSVKPGPGERLQIEPGRVWGSFTCTKLSDPGDPGSGCRVDQGYFVLENCDE